MKTNFDLVKDKSVLLDETNFFPTVKDFIDFINLPVTVPILDEDEKKIY